MHAGILLKRVITFSTVVTSSSKTLVGVGTRCLFFDDKQKQTSTRLKICFCSHPFVLSHINNFKTTCPHCIYCTILFARRTSGLDLR
jgi:hypothetical protein